MNNTEWSSGVSKTLRQTKSKGCIVGFPVSPRYQQGAWCRGWRLREVQEACETLEDDQKTCCLATSMSCRRQWWFWWSWWFRWSRMGQGGLRWFWGYFPKFLLAEAVFRASNAPRWRWFQTVSIWPLVATFELRRKRRTRSWGCRMGRLCAFRDKTSFCGHGGGHLTPIRRPLGMMSPVTCDVCHGRGKEVNIPCTTYHGTGHEKQAQRITWKLSLWETGQQIACWSQEAGFNGDPWGRKVVAL